jgi:hypothetical protein
VILTSFTVTDPESGEQDEYEVTGDVDYVPAEEGRRAYYEVTEMHVRRLDEYRTPRLVFLDAALTDMAEHALLETVRNNG